MPSLVTTPTQVIFQSTAYTAHQETGTPTVTACTSVSDAASKLTALLTPSIGGTAASASATAFTARQSTAAASGKHTVALGNSTGLTAVYLP